ncbi:hypothetical protein [Streptomyces sp. NPDC056883]|uniref:hypothetical protein n=1 Tax=Streptomyces sp. NPDC056883 TaxID=3345959 RepID=UPI00369311BD
MVGSEVRAEMEETLVGVIERMFGKGEPDPPYSDWPVSYAAYQADLAVAAGIGVARVRCHGHTWAYLLENVAKDGERAYTTGPMKQGSAFRPPTEDEVSPDDDGMVTVPLSGITLAAVLSWCRNIQHSDIHSEWTATDRAIGRRVGAAVSQALGNVVPSDAGASATAVVYLDDRIAAKDTTV